MADKTNRRTKSIAELKTASDLTQKLDEVKRHRSKLERDWKLNLSFYRGNQYVYMSKTGRLESLPVEPGDMPRYRVRLTANQILPGVQSLLSKLTKTKPILSATPQSASQSDVKAAQMAEFLLEDWWVTLGLEDKLEEALLWSILAGQGWWKISWDANAGVPMTFTMNPETGEVITNDELVTLFKTQLTEVGLEEDFADHTVHLGDVKVDAISPFQVWLDPSAKVWTDAKYAFCAHPMTPDDIKSQFGADVEADRVPNDPDKSLPFGTVSDEGSQNPSVKEVFFGYFLPQPALPKGRYVVWIEEGTTQQPKDGVAQVKKNILHDEPWPYPFNVLPLVKFAGVRVPGSIYDDALVTNARPLQKELNRTLSQIVEYKNLTLKPRVWAPLGSLKTRLTSEPGAVYEFQPIAGLKPEVEELKAMPPYVFEYLRDISQRLKEMFGLSEVSEGTVPPNVEAGVAIDLLQEMSTDRLAPTIKLVETSLARAGKLLLSLAQIYYVEPRLLKVRGGGGSSQVKKFKGADIAGGIDVIAESGSGLPRTRAGRQARIESYVDRGILAPHQAWKYIDIADMRSVAAKFAADEDQAFREHDKILQGQPLNMVQFSMAQQAIMAGINPETGDPISDEQEAIQLLERAALNPGPADNHASHLDVHHDYIVSVEFDSLPPEIQNRFYTHFELTQQASKATAPVPDGQAPRVNLSLRGTLGPTVASEIMRKAGVEATADDFTEIPLETMVYDSVDKPDTDPTNSNMFDEEQRIRELAELDTKNELEVAKAVHKMAMEERKVRAAERAKSNGGK